jgi:amino acid transporter
MSEPERLTAAAAIEERDEGELSQWGYKQELKRDWGLAHNFGISFSIISVITGLTTLFSYGLNTGGPAVMSIGWIVVSFFTFIVALGMAEIVSAVPTSGGPYFWSAILAPPGHAAFASWITGWFNLLGQVAVTTGITFGCAGLISTLATVKTGYEPTPGKTLGIYAALLVSHGAVNTFGVHILRYLNNTSILLHSAGVTAICIAVLAKAPTHQPASFVFGTFNDGTGLNGADGWSIRASPAYIACCGALLSQYTLTGFDASAHLSEETRKASWSAPIGVISSVGFSALFGFFVLMAFLFSIQDFDNTLASAYGQPVLQIFVDCLGEDGAIVLFTLIIICVWHCGLFSMTSNSRMMFGFSRDRGLVSPVVPSPSPATPFPFFPPLAPPGIKSKLC